MGILAENHVGAEGFLRHFGRALNLANLTLALEVASTCSLRCPGCQVAMSRPEMWRAESEKLMAPRLIDAALTFGREIGATRLTLLGGEPTLHPELPSIVHAGTRLGYRVSITTNGVCPAARLDAILASGLSGISFSLDGSTPGIHDAIRPAANGRSTFGTTVASIRRAVRQWSQHGYAVCVNHTLFPRNLHDAEAMIRFAAGLGVDRIRLHFTLPGDFPESDGRVTFLDPGRWLALRERLPGLAQELGVPISAPPGYGQPAVAGVWHRKSPYLTIQPDGSIILCAAYTRLPNRAAHAVGRLLPTGHINVSAECSWDDDANSHCSCPIPGLLMGLPRDVRDAISSAGGMGCVILTGPLVPGTLRDRRGSDPSLNGGSMQTENDSSRLLSMGVP